MAPFPAHAQLQAPSTGGLAAVDRELRMLGRYQRVLVIGAHPDDEDTQLLAVLSRGVGAEAAYLSLTRGEGGQNLIGPELGEALGLVRTEELLGARALDGARQFFTRAYDFGYSKTLEDVWGQWPRDSLLKDVVRVVRRFRPQVVVSVFTGTPRDGHGQHQAAGWAAHEAFRVAGDEGRFPELATEEGLPPWAPFKLYRSARFDTAAATLRIPGGDLDPVEGQSLYQIAMRSRSLHRSQDMGALQRLGPSTVRLALVTDRTGAGGGGLFAGVDTSLGAIPGLPAGSRAAWDSLGSALRALRAAPALARLAEARDRLARAAGPDPGPELTDQLARLEAALYAADRILCDALSDRRRVVAGQEVRIALTCYNAGDAPRAVVVGLRLAGRRLHTVRLSLAPGALAQEDVPLAVPDDLPSTQPYFLRRARQGAFYTWPTDAAEVLGAPREPPLLEAEFRTDVGGVTRREVARRENDQAVGEVRHPVTAVSRVDVRLEQAEVVWPVAATAPRTLRVTLTHGTRDTTAGVVRLELPPGWPAVPPQAFRFTREEERRTFRFTVRPPAALRPGTFVIRAAAEDAAGRRYAAGARTVAYPHIRPLALLDPSEAQLRIAELALPSVRRIGYVRGASDLVPEALSAVGLPVTLLDREALEQGDFDRYDAIVVGSRAYETDPALVEANERLLAYARRGGLVLVQYQQYQFFNGRYAPYLLTVGGQSPAALLGATDSVVLGGRAGGINRHDRVTDEAAPVTVLRPDHPVVTRPNRLGPSDWDGWVQERGLYFARQWDTAFTPVLAMRDPGEEPLEGGLLVARVGRGLYVYTGLSFFRQLPAGVPGAFRLFANLLALAPAGGR